MQNKKNRCYSVIAKPIGSLCNLRCKYCYYLNKNQVLTNGKLRMSDELLEEYVRQLIFMHGTDAEIEFAWHGGEPTLCGVSFFRKALAFQHKHGEGRKIVNTLQTNGTLLNDEWCAFFAENKFLIGISIDGPQHLHDYYRKDCNGNGTFDKVINGISLLKKYNIEFNTLTTVNRINQSSGVEIYQFLSEITDYMQFLPVTECDMKSSIATPPGLNTLNVGLPIKTYSVTPIGYGDFLCSVFDEWRKKDIGKKHVQIFESTIGNMIGKPAGLCVNEAVCGQCSVIERNGDIYSCDRYVFDEYKLGNIKDSSLENLMQHNRAFGEYKLESLSSKCLHCNVVRLCYGGCPKDRHRASMTSNDVQCQNYLCDGYKKFYTHFAKNITPLLQPK